eukprot:PITA_34856
MKATGMQINFNKSQLIMEGFSGLECAQISAIFPFEASNMETPFKYLGFRLKPNSYKKQDWNWLLAKIEAKINHWSFRWLSRVGRLTLVNSVLQAMPVFWAALTWIPKGTLHKIKKLCNRFLWSGSKEDSVLPWVAWDKIARPKDWGGWGIKNLNDFSISLAAKSGWRLITSENLWTRVVKRKYIDPKPMEEWICKHNKKGRNVSVIWKATTEAFKVIEQGLAWQVGNGENVRIGRDPWVGCNELFALSPGLLRHLEFKGIVHLSQVEKIGQSTIWGQSWKSGADLEISPLWWNEWQTYIQELERSNVRIRDRLDQLVWAHADSGSYAPKWWNHSSEGNLRNLPPIVCWGVWLARNRGLFKDNSPSTEATAIQSTAVYSSIPEPENTRNKPQSREETIRVGVPWAYFDRASQTNSAGAGIIIHLNDSHSLMASVGLGTGSNNYAELTALKLLLCWLVHRHICVIQIFGDSLNVVKWVNGNSRCQNYMLRPLLEEILSLKQSFNHFSIAHIYRDRNEDADRLSKDGLLQAVGIWKVTEKVQE